MHAVCKTNVVLCKMRGCIAYNGNPPLTLLKLLNLLHLVFLFRCQQLIHTALLVCSIAVVLSVFFFFFKPQERYLPRFWLSSVLESFLSVSLLKACLLLWLLVLFLDDNTILSLTWAEHKCCIVKVSWVLMHSELKFFFGLCPIHSSLVLLNQGCNWQLEAFQAWRGKGGAGGANHSVLNIWSVSCFSYSETLLARLFSVGVLK